MAYIQFNMFSGGTENYSLARFFETAAIILAIKISNNKIFIFKII
jgi:hypothetical protein